jgi:hypothetical protein
MVLVLLYLALLLALSTWTRNGLCNDYLYKDE